jgi:hypothetical protein
MDKAGARTPVLHDGCTQKIIISHLFSKVKTMAYSGPRKIQKTPTAADMADEERRHRSIRSDDIANDAMRVALLKHQNPRK